MEFMVDIVEYKVAEFYEAFNHQFPMLAMVTVGYCSDLMSETFDKGQGLRIHTVSKQKRVVAKQTNNGQDHLFSIPLDYPIKFHVSKKNVKKDNGKSLREILVTQSLPVVVQFAKGHEFYMGSRKVSTDSLPALTLIDTFEETYLLCNTLFHESLDDRPVPIPLYLKYIRLSRILGFKDQSKKKEFDNYVTKLDNQSARFIYDPTYGNEDIAVYNPNDVHSCSQYAYMQPDAYSDISILYDNRGVDTDTYDLADFTVADNQVKQSGFNVADNTEVQQSSETEYIFMDPFDMIIQKTDSMSPKNQPPPIQPKPITVKSDILREPPPIPLRRKPSMPQNDQSIILKGDNLYALKGVSSEQKMETRSSLYENILGNVHGSHLTSTSPGSSSQIAAEAPVAFHADVISPNTTYSNAAKQKEPNYRHSTTVQSGLPQFDGCQISEMSIDQIGQCLTYLGLGHYVDTFKDNGVDGMILNEFDEQLLVEDFGFKKLEVIKLMQFIRRGHIPK